MMEKIEQTVDKNEINNLENEAVDKTDKDAETNNQVSLVDVNKEIYNKQLNINSTQSSINQIRFELGLEESNETPPSILSIKESIDKLNEIKLKKEVYNFSITEPLEEESPEEYISRSMRSVVNEYIDNDPNTSKINHLTKRSYYGKHASPSMDEFFSYKGNSSKIKDLLLKLEVNDNKKFSEEKNKRVIEELIKGISTAGKDLATGDIHNKIDYYSNTNQERDFFSFGKKYDAYSYSSMMFGLPESFVSTTEGKEYIHNLIDNKTIFLFGGGDSVKDLLKSKYIKPKKVINFDPFIKEETIDKNPNGIYESQMISASDNKIREMVDKNEISKADEVWATYSVPFYLDTPEEIKNLIKNMSSVLNEGGNARISPVAVQPTAKNGESSERRGQALIDSIKNLLDNSDYNVSIFNDTLKIHKIKKEIKQ